MPPRCRRSGFDPDTSIPFGVISLSGCTNPFHQPLASDSSAYWLIFLGAFGSSRNLSQTSLYPAWWYQSQTGGEGVLPILRPSRSAPKAASAGGIVGSILKYVRESS